LEIQNPSFAFLPPRLSPHPPPKKCIAHKRSWSHLVRRIISINECHKKDGCENERNKKSELYRDWNACWLQEHALPEGKWCSTHCLDSLHPSPPDARYGCVLWLLPLCAPKPIIQEALDGSALSTTDRDLGNAYFLKSIHSWKDV
jgi:hypothetical protein